LTLDIDDPEPPPQPQRFAGKYELGDASTPRRRKIEPSYPREAKIPFAIGISMIVFIGLIPIVRIAMNALVKPDEIPATAATAPTDSSSGGARPSTRRGGEGVAAGGDTDWRGTAPAPRDTGGLPVKGRPDDDSVPMTPAAYETLKRLWRYIYEMSHLPKGAPVVNPKEGDWFDPEMLEGAPDDVIRNLTLLQLRVAHQPLLGLRVLSEEHNLGITTFQLEVISMAPDFEISAGTLVDLAPAGEETMRIVRFERLAAFDDGSKQDSATPEAAVESPPEVRAGRLPPPRSVDGSAQQVDARYPYTIR
jgi:hypothetical protein